jgi:predicted transcriptional regulator
MGKRNPAAHEEISDAALEEGIAQADRGELVAHEKVGDWIKSLRTTKPTRPPKPKRSPCG